MRALRFPIGLWSGAADEDGDRNDGPRPRIEGPAEILQRWIAFRQPSALARLRRLPEFRVHSDDELRAAAAHVRRRQCLTLLATELGFSGWPAAKAALSGTGPWVDFGTVLYPKRCGGHLNLWYRRYDAAVTGRHACAGYLLAYRRDFIVV